VTPLLLKESLAKKTNMGPGVWAMNYIASPCDSLAIKRKLGKKNRYGAGCMGVDLHRVAL